MMWKKELDRRGFLGLAMMGGVGTLVGAMVGCKPVPVGGASVGSVSEGSGRGAEEMEMATIIDRVTLRVRDLGRQVEFYEEVVGLRVLGEGAGRAELGVSGGEVLLKLVEDREAPGREPTEAGLFHIAFRVPDEASLADALRRVQGKHRLDGASNHDVSHALYLQDMEGNGLEIYYDRPRSEWPMGANGQVVMATRRLDLGALLAQEPRRPERFPEGTDVGHIHLEGRSIGVWREYLGGVLGMDVMMEVPSALFMARDGYHHHVGLNIWNRRSVPRREEALGLMEIEIALPTGELGRLERSAASMGVEVVREGEVMRIVDPDNLRWAVRAQASRQ